MLIPLLVCLLESQILSKGNSDLVHSSFFPFFYSVVDMGLDIPEMASFSAKLT